jgi:hypothetical protein
MSSFRSVALVTCLALVLMVGASALAKSESSNKKPTGIVAFILSLFSSTEEDETEDVGQTRSQLRIDQVCAPDDEQCIKQNKSNRDRPDDE